MIDTFTQNVVFFADSPKI